ncbi:AI-2E family transporter [Nesterenkonia sp. Act20]|uniref:AI-2E family transporter n=1 Tax=Nesterenkonia sp. Act20 TaxID=1483432 RepID=UPI00210030EF|nr:AI-2E family transporter [Nesterenkonia sp. Act20]
MGRLSIRSLQLLLIGAVAGLLVFAMLNLTVVVIPTLIAIILASALWPLVQLARRGMPTVLAAWTVLLGALLVIGGVGTGLVFSVINQWPTLVDQAVQGINQLRQVVDDLMSNFGITIDQEQIDGAIDSATTFLTSSAFGTGAVNTIGAAGSFLTSLILLLVVLFFFLKDGDRIWAFFISWTPQHFRDNWIASGDRAVQTFGSYIRGTALIAAIDAIAITIALLILQVPLALPLGVIIFLGGFIPVIGATVAGALATLVALVTNGPVVALIILAVVIVVQQLDGNLLQPVVMAQTLNLHALVILIALTAGTVLAGVVGALLSVPLTAVAWDIIKVWTGRDQTPEFGPVAQAREQIASAQDEDDRDQAHDNHSPDPDDGLENGAPEDEPSSSRP